MGSLVLSNSGVGKLTEWIKETRITTTDKKKGRKEEKKNSRKEEWNPSSELIRSVCVVYYSGGSNPKTDSRPNAWIRLCLVDEANKQDFGAGRERQQEEKYSWLVIIGHGDSSSLISSSPPNEEIRNSSSSLEYRVHSNKGFYFLIDAHALSTSRGVTLSWIRVRCSYRVSSEKLWQFKF